MDESPSPSKLTMLSNLIKSAKDIVTQSVKSGIVKASDEKALGRMNICKACEFFNADELRCNKCGCFMEVKVWFDGSKCPIDKW